MSIAVGEKPPGEIPEIALIPKKGGTWSKIQKVALAILILGGAVAIGVGLGIPLHLPVTIGVAILTFSFGYFGSDILAYLFPRIQE